MSEERLQEIKDSINLQYKVQEANDLHSFNIFTDEEQELVEEIERLNTELENRDDVLEEFEDWLERQKTRNNEWDNFIMINGRLGIPISYLLNKLQELKGNDKE